MCWMCFAKSLDENDDEISQVLFISFFSEQCVLCILWTSLNKYWEEQYVLCLASILHTAYTQLRLLLITRF